MEQKIVQKLDVCKKNGVATHWTANLYKCSEKAPCPNKRDFGWQKYCTDNEKPMPLKKED
jgi:hypothetical protein